MNGKLPSQSPRIRVFLRCLCLGTFLLMPIADVAGGIGTLFAQGSETDAARLIEGASIFGDADRLELECLMTIDTAQGRKTRTVEAYIERDERVSKILLHIVAPGFLNQMKFLTHIYADGREYTWMRTSRGTTRLSGADRNMRVFDSDFTVEDFSDLTLQGFSLRRLPERTLDGVSCQVVEAVPEDPGRGYQVKVVYLDAEDSFIRGLDYLDDEGEPIRSYRVLTTQTVGGRSAPLRCRMSTPAEGSETILEFTETLVPDSIPARIFNKASL